MPGLFDNQMMDGAIQVSKCSSGCRGQVWSVFWGLPRAWTLQHCDAETNVIYKSSKLRISRGVSRHYRKPLNEASWWSRCQEHLFISRRGLRSIKQQALKSVGRGSKDGAWAVNARCREITGIMASFERPSKTGFLLRRDNFTGAPSYLQGQEHLGLPQTYNVKH